jgi:hypothetical protein
MTDCQIIYDSMLGTGLGSLSGSYASLITKFLFCQGRQSFCAEGLGCSLAKFDWSVGSVRFANVHTSEGMPIHLLFPSIFL